MEGDRVVVEVGPNAAKKGTTGKECSGFLGLKCSLEIQDLDYLTEKTKVEEAIKFECPELPNTRRGIPSANSRGQSHHRCKLLSISTICFTQTEDSESQKKMAF